MGLRIELRVYAPGTDGRVWNIFAALTGCIFEFDSDSFGSFRLAQRALDEGWLLLTMDDRFIGGIVVVDGR